MGKVKFLNKKADEMSKMIAVNRAATFRAITKMARNVPDEALFNSKLREARNLVENAIVILSRLEPGKYRTDIHMMRLDDLSDYIDELSIKCDNLTSDFISSGELESASKVKDAYKILAQANYHISEALKAMPGYPNPQITIDNFGPLSDKNQMSYPYIDSTIQEKVRDFAVIKGLAFYNMDILKKTEDAKLGPVTRDMIEKCKQYLNSQDAYTYDEIPLGPSGDQELFSVITKELSAAKSGYDAPASENGEGIEEVMKRIEDQDLI